MEVLKTFPKGSEIVSLIVLPEYLPCTKKPGPADYDNPVIRKIIPCLKKDGVYQELRSLKPVAKNENTLEWKVFSGTVFTYPDKTNVLISRRFDNREFLGFVISAEEFHRETMTRHKAKL